MDTIKTNITNLLFCQAIDKYGFTVPITVKPPKNLFSFHSFFEVIYFLNYFLQRKQTFNNANVYVCNKKKSKLLIVKTDFIKFSLCLLQYFLYTPKKKQFEKSII